jgi:hypothetical protein
MSAIHVELDCPHDAEELVAFLATRGLAGTVRETDDHCELTVGWAEDPEVALRRAFERALETWVSAHERPLVPAARGGTYVLRPPGD